MNENKKNKIIYKLAEHLKCKQDTLRKLSAEQITYINNYLKKSTYLEACPGSGKTEVIGLKCAYEIKKWHNSIGGLAVITFTNSAATELSLRIKKFADLSSNLYPHFIGTFDSWLHSYIFQPFAHYLTKYEGKNGDKSYRIVDDDSHADFLASFTVIVERGTTRIPMRATDYHYTADWRTLVGHSEIIEGMLNGLTNQEKTHLRENKVKFLKAGFATYSDAEIICNTILNRFAWVSGNLSKRFPVIIVDECQDLSEDQIAVLESLRAAGRKIIMAKIALRGCYIEETRSGERRCR